MVRKLGPRFHRIGSLYPLKDFSVKGKQELSSLQIETISSTGSNSSTAPNSPSDSATIVGSPVSTRASSPFETEFSDIKSQDYFCEFTTLFSKSSSTSVSSESPDSPVSTPDYSLNLSTPCNNKYNLSYTGLQKTYNNRVTKRKSSAKKGIRKLQYEQIITFNDNIKPNDVIPEEEQFTNLEMVPNVKSEYTFVEENLDLLSPSIYMQEQHSTQAAEDPNLWGIQMPYFTYDNYCLPNGPLKDGGSGDVFLTDWNDKDFVLDP